MPNAKPIGFVIETRALANLRAWRCKGYHVAELPDEQNCL